MSNLAGKKALDSESGADFANPFNLFRLYESEIFENSPYELRFGASAD